MDEFTLEELKRQEKEQDPALFMTNSIISTIRAYRIRLEVSQRKLSELSGIPQKTISRMENGLSTPTLVTLLRLIHALELDAKFNITPRK